MQNEGFSHLLPNSVNTTVHSKIIPQKKGKEEKEVGRKRKGRKKIEKESVMGMGSLLA